MKRVGGKVTWLCEFDGPRAELASKGVKRQTMRRCHIVAAGDTLRLSTGGEAGVFAEVEVARVSQIEIGLSERGGRLVVWAELNGCELSKDAFEALAVMDGFANGHELVEWLDNHGKFEAGYYDGQLIEW